MSTKKGLGGSIRIVVVSIIVLVILFLVATFFVTGSEELTEMGFRGKTELACHRFETRGCCINYDEEDPGQCAVDKIWEGYNEEEMDEEELEKLEEVDWEEKCC